MKQRFLQLEPRQQLATAAATAVVVALLAGTMLLQLHNSQQQAQRQLIQTVEELTQVQALTAQLAALHVSAATASDDAADLTAIVSRSLQSFGLQPTRIQQGATDELQLRLDGVQYADAIAWLAALEQNGAVVLLRATFSQGAGDTSNLSLSLKKRP